MHAAWWWIDRWRQSTAFTDMSAEEQGLFRNLLDEIWLRPDHIIPDDPRTLAKASGDTEAWGRLGVRVLKWMVRVDGGWTNETALEVIDQSRRRAQKQKDYRNRRQQGGNETGNAQGNAAGNKPGSPSPSPSPSLISEERKPPLKTKEGRGTMPNGFADLYARILEVTEETDTQKLRAHYGYFFVEIGKVRLEVGLSIAKGLRAEGKITRSAGACFESWCQGELTHQVQTG